MVADPGSCLIVDIRFSKSSFRKSRYRCWPWSMVKVEVQARSKLVYVRKGICRDRKTP